jgi:N-acetylglucosamine-6-sulfatase
MRLSVFLALLVFGISSCSKEDINTLEDYKLDITYSVEANRPNILLFLVDDLREDATPYSDDPLISYFPGIDRMQREGIRFANAFVTTSLCSPSRASILSGLYASKHKVIKNDDRYKLGFSMGTIFSECGYRTAFIGKWHMGDQSTNPFPQNGWDNFISFYEQGQYIDPEMIVNGDHITDKGHITSILTDYAIQYINKVSQDEKDPFLLFLSHKGVHHPFKPMDEHLELFENLEKNFRFPSSFNNSVCYQNSPQADPNNLEYFKKRYRNYYQSIKGIDDSLGKIIQTLEKWKILDNTILIFMSDNGYFHGEHKLVDKRYAYEESIKIPLIIRFPKEYSSNAIRDDIVLNIDVLPTILDLCNIKIRNFQFDGSSIRNMSIQHPLREYFLYQYFENLRVEVKPYPEIKAIRSQKYKLITYPNLFCPDEFYDLEVDPMETKNLINDQAYKNIIQDHYSKLMVELVKYQ